MIINKNDTYVIVVDKMKSDYRFIPKENGDPAFLIISRDIILKFHVYDDLLQRFCNEHLNTCHKA